MAFSDLRWGAAGLCAALAVGWLVWPGAILALWKVRTDPGDLWGSRRGGALFAGMAVILAGAPLSGSDTLAITNGFALACLLLGALGISAALRRQAGRLVWVAVIVELGLAGGMSYLARG